MVVAIIPARGGSKGVPGKNIRVINGRPLIAWSIAQALASEGIHRVIVSTDSEEIAQVAREAGAEVPGLRPVSLASDEAPTEPVLIHVLERWCRCDPDDAVVLLQPTSPLRLEKSIDRAIEAFLAHDADSLVSVCEAHSFFWRNPLNPVASYDYTRRPRRQDIAPDDRWYRENGSIYITKVGLLMANGNRLSGRVMLYQMSECESHEIDSDVDFSIVEQLMMRNC